MASNKLTWHTRCFFCGEEHVAPTVVNCCSSCFARLYPQRPRGAQHPRFTILGSVSGRFPSTPDWQQAEERAKRKLAQRADQRAIDFLIEDTFMDRDDE